MKTFGIALVVALAWATGGCGGEADEDVAPGDMRVPVTIVEARRDTLTVRLSLVGRIGPSPGGRALLTAPAPAVVGRVATEVGASVRRGQVLIALDAPELAAEATAKAAEAAAARSDARRQQELLREGIVAQKQAEAATATAGSSAAAAAAARALLARAQVASPIAGIVDRVFVQPGERVEAGAELVAIVNGGTVEFEAAVPAADLLRLHAGQVATVTVEGLERSQLGVVRAVAPAVDSVTNAGRVLIRLANPGGLLRIGAGATAVIEIASVAGAIVVPETALVPTDEGIAVLVVKADSTVERRAVLVGAKDGTRVEVTGPLKAGEHVVATGGYGLESGMRVRVTGRTSP